MLLIRLLLVLFWTSVTVNQSAKPIPQFMVGEVPAKGEPYQIVRIIEYVVPHPYEPPVKNREATDAEDSLEIIAPHIENQFVTTPKPTVTTNFIVKIYPMMGLICTGALISRRLVLTSAQCFPANRAPMPEQYMVQVASSAMYNLDTIVMGPSSDLDRYMALMVLRISVEEREAQPVELCDVPPKRGDNVIMYMSKQLPRYLRTRIVSNRICKNTFASIDAAYITENMFCSHNSNKRKDCQTTMGDPLVHEERLCGINIYGPRCVDGGINGDLYASVFKVKKHLQSMIQRFK
ncbi:seminase [Drosophila guanche]|uniref:Blast:Trypsin, alkaline B n=1 Tax=Drosophila guanche TaxID=7266 RepID=A0A3B0JJ52_DROGU|nr:seminase [Drosophila guanche]SPP80783.1 blast:Trypsin%2C alkaline B [Drosophila guanche]